MVTHADFVVFGRACERLYRPGLTAESFARHATDFLRELLAADVYCVGDLDTRSGALGVDFSVEDAMLPKLPEGVGRTKGRYELFKRDEKVSGGASVFSGDFFTARRFKELDVYAESFALMGWTDHSAVQVPTVDGHMVFIGLGRRGAAEFSERDRVMLGLAQEQLANARCLAAELQGMQRRAGRAGPEVFMGAGFSARQAEVLVWLTEGKTNAEMAQLMHLSLPTVKYHLTEIFNRIGAGNRLAATLHALRVARQQDEAGNGRRLSVRLEARNGEGAR